MSNTPSSLESSRHHAADLHGESDPFPSAPRSEGDSSGDGPKDAATNPARRSRVRRWLLPAAATLCVASWIALGAGVASGAGTGMKLVLATIAALATEGLVWLAAMLLGLRAFEARRYLMDRARRMITRRG